jgi:hypothetical protein
VLGASKVNLLLLLLYNLDEKLVLFLSEALLIGRYPSLMHDALVVKA